jgi:hypothetical protein
MEEISGSHGGENESYSLLGYGTVKWADVSEVRTASTIRKMSK